MLTNLAVLGTGEVLAVGDDPECGVASEGSDTAEVGDPGRRTWALAPAMSSARTGPHLVALSDGRALVTGGATPESDGYLAKSSTLVFRPRARSWVRSGLLNTARMNAGAVALQDGSALIAGGQYIGTSFRGRALDSAERWEPGSGTWSEVGRMSTPRIDPEMVVLADGRVLVVGGLPAPGADDRALASAELFDPGAGRWAAAGSLTAWRMDFGLVALPDGGALVVGGYTTGGDGNRFTPASVVERFDPHAVSWTALAGTNIPAAAVPVLLKDGRVFVLSGAAVRIIDPQTGATARAKSLPGGRGDATAVLLPDGSVMVGGGWSVPPDEGSTPSCTEPDRQVWRFVPGG